MVRPEEFAGFLANNNMVLKIHAAKTEWQIGTIERSIGTIKDILKKLVMDNGGGVDDND